MKLTGILWMVLSMKTLGCFGVILIGKPFVFLKNIQQDGKSYRIDP